MHIATHAMLSWLLAEAAPADRLDRRSRAAITLAGLSPDLDGFGAPFQVLSGGALTWFSDYHHRLLHNGLTCLAVASLAWLWCRRDGRVFCLALIAAHLHLLCDLAGSRGPDGHDWPIPYLTPFSTWEWRWSGQWPLNAWPNIVTTITALVLITWLGARRGRTPVSLIHPGLDARIAARMRVWWGGKLRDPT